VLLAFLASLVYLYVKGNLNKKSGLIAAGCYIGAILALSIVGKLRGPKTCAVRGKAD
jgi:hypothetical protein